MSRRTAARNESGAVAVLVALLSLVLFGMAAIVVDLGHTRAVRLEMQSVADASALAAANRLYLTGTADPTAAATAAKQYALDNYKIPLSSWNTGTCLDPSPLGSFAAGTKCISFNSATTPTEVRVFLPSHNVDTPISGLFGSDSINLNAGSNARITPGGSGSCGLCVLGTANHDVQNGNIAVTNGNVAMNGTVSAQNNGGITVTGGSLAVQGGKSGNKGTFSPTITTGVTVTDPLANMPMPTIPAAFANKGATNPCAAGGGPGWYSSFSAASSCTLSPGLYVISGNTKLAGQHDIRGTGVTLYFVCGSYPTPVACTSTNSWSFDMNSQNTYLNITAATTNPLNGAVPNLAIVADRGWTGTLSFQGGGGGGTTTGTMYLASGTLSYGGNTQAQALNASVIVKDLSMNGNPSNFSINYSPSQNVSLAPTNLHLCYHAPSTPLCN